jgi:hypothetical protein
MKRAMAFSAPAGVAWMMMLLVAAPSAAARKRKWSASAVRDYVAVAKTLQGDDGPSAVTNKASDLGRPDTDHVRNLDDGSHARFISWTRHTKKGAGTPYAHLIAGFYECRREHGPSWCLISATVSECAKGKCNTVYEMPHGAG